MKKLYLFLSLAFILCGISSGWAQTWTALGDGLGTATQGSAIVSSITSYSGNLIVGGEFAIAGGAPASNIAMWDGSAWHPLGAGISGNNAEIFAMIAYNGELYAGGEFDSAGGQPANNIAKWNGSQWTTVGAGVTGPYGEITSMAVYNNQLIVGGNFNLAGSTAVQNIAAWDGNSWSSLDTTTLWTSQAMITSMCTWNGDLYVGSEGTGFTNSAGTSIGKWNGTSWQVLEDSTIAKSSEVNILCTYNGNLYAGGRFYNSTYNDSMLEPDVAMWTGNNWQNLGIFNNSGFESFGVDVLTGYNNELFAAGYFWNIGGQPDTLLCSYNGTSWTQLNAPNIAQGIAYYTSYVWNGGLYIGGIFSITAEGGNTALNIAEYRTTTAITPVLQANPYVVYPNPGSTWLTIENITHGETFFITNVLGQPVTKVIAGSNKQVIDISALEPGMYFVKGTKFIKE